MITIKTKHSKSTIGNVDKRSDVENDNDNDGVDHTIELEAFGQKFVVPLKRNLNILSPFANVVDTTLDPETGKSHPYRLRLASFHCRVGMG